MTNESTRDIKVRLERARGLVSQSGHARDYLDEKGQELTGRIYVITTFRTGKGEEDFKRILQRQYHKVHAVFRIDWLQHQSKALFVVIEKNWDQFKSGDIVAIVRGGGNTNDPSFAPFEDRSALEILKRLRVEKKIVLVTGIGHSTDNFCVDNAATFRQVTPTDAAYKICELLDEKET